MTPFEIAALLGLSVFAIYRQSIRHEVIGTSRFKLAIIYAAIGVALGGLAPLMVLQAWAGVGVGLLLSAAVGIARGRLSRVWVEADGRVYGQGTLLTIALFVLLIATKFAIGAVEYHLQGTGKASDGRFGEVLILIGLMVALQSEIVWRRAKALVGREPSLAAQPARYDEPVLPGR